MQRPIRAISVDGKTSIRGGSRSAREVATTTARARIAAVDLLVWGAMAVGLAALAAALLLR